jgi:hypothetical protein
MRPPRSPSSEFPNDNPDLHEGIIWAVSEPCSAPAPLPSPSTAEAEAEAEAEGGCKLDLECESEEIAECTAPAPPVLEHGAPPPDDHTEPFEEDAFTWLLRAMSSCAVEAGSIVDLEDLEMLLGAGRIGLDAFPTGATEALCEAGIATIVGDELVASDSFVATAHAWRGVLAGEDVDVSDCGARTLDEWCSDLLARVVGAPQRADLFRRELRRRGVAAFGVLTDAA